MRRRLLILVLLVSSAAAYAGGPVLPKGWRDPKPAELGEGPTKTLLVGDFDGNGLTDGAVLAVTEDGKEEGLLAFMYFGNKEKWFVLERHPVAKARMAMDLYKPGTYPVLCASVPGCKKGYKAPLALEHDAIAYYLPESARSIFLWNAKRKAFDRIWESD